MRRRLGNTSFVRMSAFHPTQTCAALSLGGRRRTPLRRKAEAHSEVEASGAATALMLLDRRALHGSVATEHAAVPPLVASRSSHKNFDLRVAQTRRFQVFAERWRLAIPQRTYKSDL